MSHDQSSLVEKASAFAIERHGDQKYGNNLPYKWHLGKVAGLAAQLGYSEAIQAAAWLHDTVEDTLTTLDEIRDIFGDKIAEIVEGVTFSESEKASGIGKIAKARSNLGSHVIKFCDATINFSASALNGAPEHMGQWKATVDRYGAYLVQLHENLPTPEQVDAWLEAQVYYPS